MSNGFNWNQVISEADAAKAGESAASAEAVSTAPQTEMVMDPRTGQFIEVERPPAEGPQTELEMEAAKILEELDNDPVKNYKPALVDQS
ncbi:MAG: hypothetical protein H7Y17_15385, partial [Chlorobia bacterium]|nr:hypothetical protein [Fimbriimonadaceae bacterium]